MTHLLSQLDLRASTGRTPWHRSSALTKLVVAVAVLGLAIAAPSLELLAVVHGVAWALVLTSGLPLRLVLAAAGYPLVFSLLFIAARWDGTWVTPLPILLRPLTASLMATWLVGTTPYPDLFAPVSRLLPRATGDGLFLTYRALFALFARAERLWQSLRLRGGFAGPPRRRVALAGESLGTLVVHGFERSHRLYGAMLLRGHSGRICGCRHYAEMSRADLAPAGTLVVLGVAAVWLWGTT